MKRANERLVIEALATLQPNRKVLDSTIFDIDHKIASVLADECNAASAYYISNAIASKRAEYAQAIKDAKPTQT